MKLHELKPVEGARHSKKRVGRGHGSGLGKTSGRGQKGQNSRSGGGVRPGFEGGQLPLMKRLPKRGFTNYTRKEYAIVNVESLERFAAGTVVDLELLRKERLITKELCGLKILGNGELTKSLTVKATKFSESAKKSIEAAGGKIEVI